MRRREKFLLAILLLGLLAWQGARLTHRLLIAPLDRSRARLQRLDEQFAEQTNRVAELSRAAATLDDWQRQSLPPDPFTAQRLYQQWLHDLAQECGLAALKVYPDRVTRKGSDCVAVTVSINAETTLDRLCLFLSRFYEMRLAQQITLLNIDRTQDQGDPRLRVAILVEGLSLRGAAERQQLFPDDALAGDSSIGTRKADYALLVANNPFAKPVPKIVERPRPAQEARVEIDPAEFTYLVAAFAEDDERQAWLYDRLNNANVVIQPGQPFSVAGVEGIVQAIGDDFVLLDHNQMRWRLRLGKNLRSMERVATESNTTSPTEPR